jgi:hypothetical protein
VSLQCQKIEIKKLPFLASDITNFTSAVCAVVLEIPSISGEPIFETWAQTYSADLYSSFTTVESNSANWNYSYSTVLTGGDIGGDLTVQGSLSSSEVIYFSGGNSNEIAESLYKNYNSSQESLISFINTEWYRGIINKSGTVNLTTNGRIYMLAELDGSSVNHYIEINPKPVSNFVVSGIADYGIIDTYSLNRFNSCKYIIEVQDIVLNKVHYSEINTISDGTDTAVSEYGILYTSSGALIEYGAVTNGMVVSLTGHSLLGNTSDKVFKCLRTNFFTQ